MCKFLAEACCVCCILGGQDHLILCLFHHWMVVVGVCVHLILGMSVNLIVVTDIDISFTH